MASTELAVVRRDAFVALKTDLAQVKEAIEINLDGADLTPFDLLRLTVPSGGGKSTTPRWEVPTLDGESRVLNELRGIIVFKQTSRAWWPKNLDEGGGGLPPSCASTDGGRTGFGKQWATRDDPDPDGLPVSQVCRTCPHAQFGSDGRGQACKQSEQLFLLMSTGFLPAVISAPSMSLAPFKRYMVGLSDLGIVYNQVETILTLERATNQGGLDFARIKFQLGAHLDDDGKAAAKAYGDSLRPSFQAAAQQAATAPAGADNPATAGHDSEPAEAAVA